MTTQCVMISELITVYKQHLDDIKLVRNDPIVLHYLLLIDSALPPLNLSTLQKHASLLEAHVWECLHMTHWKDVDPQYRKIYGLTSWVLAMSHASNMTLPATDIHQIIDKGILLGSPDTIGMLLSCHRYIQETSPLSDQHDRPSLLASLITNCTQSISSFKFRNTVPIHIGQNKKSISTLDEPDLMTFYTKYFLTGEPVVLRGCLENWKAMTQWSDLQYIDRVGGHRLVPVEVGRHYLSKDSGQTLMTIRDFICQYILDTVEPAEPDSAQKKRKRSSSNADVDGDGNDSRDDKIGYLAQHCLFDQIPELRKDISVPDHCCFLQPDEEGEDGAGDVLVNAWFGPVGTVSPLHHDPYHNLLAQVHGCKYIRLYHPDQSHWLKPMEGRMSNSSSIDLLSQRLEEEVPDLTRTAYEDVLLQPGDMLFIPRWYWHYCTAVPSAAALELLAKGRAESSAESGGRIDIDARECFSWSVNFWWGKRILKGEEETSLS